MSSESSTPTRPLADLVESVEALDPSAFDIDGSIPENAVRPETVAELQELVRAAGVGGSSIVPWGGGTQMGFGNTPGQYKLAVDLTGLNEVLRYEPDDMTMSVETGCRLDDLNSMLAEHRQVLPIDAAHPKTATIGGLTAVGVSGPRRLGYGPLRDLIIGITVLMADGSSATAGGQVVKNVTGYDMMRLHHGALGSMGIMLSINLKVIPKPQGERTVVAHFADFHRAHDAAIAVIESPLGVTACVVQDALAATAAGQTLDAGWALAVRCEAPPSAVVRQGERVVEYVSEHAESVRVEEDSVASEVLWRTICRALDQSRDAPDAGIRIGCPPSRMTSLVAELETRLPAHAGQFARTLDYGSGLAYLRLEPATASEVWATLSRSGEHVSLLTGPASLKQEIDVFGPRPAGFSVIEAMKQTFDPTGLFNPGRFIGRL